MISLSLVSRAPLRAALCSHAFSLTLTPLLFLELFHASPRSSNSHSDLAFNKFNSTRSISYSTEEAALMWRSNRNVPTASSVGGAPFGWSRRKGCADVAVCQTEGKLRNLFGKIGSSIESLIDATPLGVPTPCEPWSPLTDKKKAILSNPISVLKVITEIMSEYSPSRFVNSLEATMGKSTYLLQVSAMMLMGLREGLANAVLGEYTNSISDPPVIVESEDITMHGNFVDLSTEKSTNKANPETKGALKGLSNFLTKRVIPFFDSLTLFAHGIVVTSDDCSVECSLASLMDGDKFRIRSPSSVPKSISSDEDDFEDCLSVVTEIAMREELDNDDDDDDTSYLNDALIRKKYLTDSDRDDEEYVITDVSEAINDEDYVNVCAELVVQVCD